MANDTKYGGRARGLWRKTYGYQSSRPSNITFVDTINQLTRSIDLNHFSRHSDYFRIAGIISQTLSGEVWGEYDEGLVFLSGTDYGAGSFSIVFSQTPIVVLTPESASFWGENVQLYGFARSPTEFTFGTSAPYSGTIRYRALYHSSYPVSVTSDYTASFVVSAGTASLDGSESLYTASFAALTDTPFPFFQTAWNEVGSLHDVSFETQTRTSSSAVVEISAPVSGTIDFIACYTSSL